jgi:hypothetical protein
MQKKVGSLNKKALLVNDFCSNFGKILFRQGLRWWLLQTAGFAKLNFL